MDITDDDNEYAVDDYSNNEPLAEGNDNNDDEYASAAVLRASYSQQRPLRV